MPGKDVCREGQEEWYMDVSFTELRMQWPGAAMPGKDVCREGQEEWYMDVPFTELRMQWPGAVMPGKDVCREGQEEWYMDVPFTELRMQWPGAAMPGKDVCRVRLHGRGFLQACVIVLPLALGSWLLALGSWAKHDLLQAVRMPTTIHSRDQRHPLSRL